MDQPQRIAGQAVVRGFRTISLSIAEAEAGLIPLWERLRDQMIALWVSIHKLDQSHPHWMLRRKRMCRKHRSPLLRTAVMCAAVRVDDILEVKPYACPPWVERPEVVICKDKEDATAVISDYRPGQVDLF